MDILITLPKYLIEKIWNGEKKVEVRKNFPRQFDPIENAVFVVEKGTKNVCMCFTIAACYTYCNQDEAWDDFGDKICVPKDWFYNYAKGTKLIYIWYIRDRYIFPRPLDLQMDYGIKHAPQSYCYIRKKFHSFTY